MMALNPRLIILTSISVGILGYTTWATQTNLNLVVPKPPSINPLVLNAPAITPVPMAPVAIGWVVVIDDLEPATLATLQAKKLPLYQNARQTLLGPYLTKTEAQTIQAQLAQTFQINASITEFVNSETQS